MEDTKQENPYRRSKNKRTAILRAAFELYSQRGYEHTTMTDIARTAGVALGTLYKHYPDKKTLFLNMYEMYFFDVAALPLNIIKDISKPSAMRGVLESVIDIIVKEHSSAPKHTHDAMTALVNYDKEFKLKENECKLKLIDMVIPVLGGIGLSDSYYREKLHFFINVVELYTREAAYHETDGLEYAYVKDSLMDFANSFVFRL